MRLLGRIIAGMLGVPLLVIGAAGLLIAYMPGSPEYDKVEYLFRVAVQTARDAGAPLEASLSTDLLAVLSGPILRFVVAPLGLVLGMFAAGLIGGRAGDEKASGKSKSGKGASDKSLDDAVALGMKVDKRARKKVVKQASAMRKRGEILEAAELLWSHDELDTAARYFIEGEDFGRAAEIRHDQNRFLESAELHLKGGNFESAGAIFAQQEEWQQAAEAYAEAGLKSVAAEMYEKAGDHRNAAHAYRGCEFMRHAATNYVKVQDWALAAECLDAVFSDENTKGQNDPAKLAETTKLVRQIGKLYQRSGEPEKALSVLQRGGCKVEAAEVALSLKQFAMAAELYRDAGDMVKAAEALRALGEDAAAARLLGQYHRDRGDTKEAAAFLEEAGDFLEAGDLHRSLENYAEAGACFEKQGEVSQAADMFKLAGDRLRAAECFEQAGRFSEAAECHALAGQVQREAELLEKAGEFLNSGEVFHREGMDEEAIRALQKVEAEDKDFGRSSALLGDIFFSRGQLSLAIKKLQQAVGDADLDRDTVPVFYTLATIYQANGEQRQAVEIYEKILAFDYHYEDVEGRVVEAREFLRDEEPISEQVAGEPSSGAGGMTPSFGAVTPAGRYKIVGELGRGGMGIVYKATDTVLDRLVAYKVLPDSFKENAQAVTNFLREAKAAAKLNHPNIVTVYDTGEQQGRYYIAMEYVEGTTIKEILRRRGVISPTGILHVLVQLSEALSYAHEKKVVHRDIKPANAMWTRDKKAKLMDFGLARVVEEARNHTTVVAGTPYYMSPEQTLGKNIDHRTDIYSLGVMIFEMATGTVPFKEGNIPYHHVHTPAPNVRELRAEIPVALANIVERCLQKDPVNRYQSTREILAEVRESLANSITRTQGAV